MAKMMTMKPILMARRELGRLMALYLIQVVGSKGARKQAIP